MKMQTSKLLLLISLLLGQSGLFAAELKSKSLAAKSTAGSLLEYKPIFENSFFDWNHVYVNASLGSNVRIQGSVDFDVGAGYEWDYTSLGFSFHAKSGAYGAIRALPNNSGSLPDPSTYPVELARPRADDDAWTLFLYNLNFGVRGPLFFSDSHRFYQKATCALSFGKATDSINSLGFSLGGFEMTAALGFQASRTLGIEWGLASHWLDAVLKSEGALSNRSIPLHWLETRIGASLSF